jgi:hypothetical protein
MGGCVLKPDFVGLIMGQKPHSVGSLIGITLNMTKPTRPEALNTTLDSRNNLPHIGSRYNPCHINQLNDCSTILNSTNQLIRIQSLQETLQDSDSRVFFLLWFPLILVVLLTYAPYSKG